MNDLELDLEQWERVAQYWPIVADALSEHKLGLLQRLVGCDTIEDVRRIQGEIFAIGYAMNLPGEEIARLEKELKNAGTRK